jgi:hypothetical protein
MPSSASLFNEFLAYSTVEKDCLGGTFAEETAEHKITPKPMSCELCPLLHKTSLINPLTKIS